MLHFTNSGPRVSVSCGRGCSPFPADPRSPAQTPGGARTLAVPPLEPWALDVELVSEKAALAAWPQGIAFREEQKQNGALLGPRPEPKPTWKESGGRRAAAGRERTARGVRGCKPHANSGKAEEVTNDCWGG